MSPPQGHVELDGINVDEDQEAAACAPSQSHLASIEARRLIRPEEILGPDHDAQAARADAPAGHEAAQPRLRGRHRDMCDTEGMPANRPPARGAL